MRARPKTENTFFWSIQSPNKPRISPRIGKTQQVEIYIGSTCNEVNRFDAKNPHERGSYMLSILTMAYASSTNPKRNDTIPKQECCRI